ncbi:MAG: cobalamin biosynthesis protein CbiG [Methanosarcinaceae archaeon]|mgnify:CR=1 FL=1|nr:cobalamin biosynthesis protein CbiG [Methanosarcinaceae archaeon]
MDDLRIAVVTFERNKEVALTVSNHLNGDIILYEKGIFGKLIDTYDVIVAMFATGIAIREIVPYISGKWKDPALVVVDSALNFAIPVLGGHHGGNDVARKLSDIGVLPVITTATEVHDKMSVEGIAKRFNCDVVNKYSTIAVNSALLDGDVKIVSVKGPKIVIVDEDVSVLVRKENKKETEKEYEKENKNEKENERVRYFLPDEEKEIFLDDDLKFSKKEML